jgi:dihydrofolate reductase
MIVGMFAVNEAGGIGLHNALPWPKNAEDMKWFRDTTMGHTVVMGRNTWDSCDMPKPLPGRKNVVFSNRRIDVDGVDCVSGNVPEVLKEYAQNSLVFVIGGALMLLQARPVMDKMYITRIPGDYGCTVRLKMRSFLHNFKLVDAFDFKTCRVEEYVSCANG